MGARLLVMSLDVVGVTLDELRAMPAPNAQTLYFLQDDQKRGLFYYDQDDVTTADNTGTVVVSAGGARFKRVVQNPIDVRWFGVRNDGTDCYLELKALADALSDMESAVVHFPPGTYRIDQYRITDGPDKNGIGNIVFDGCRGVKLIGYGAVIDVKGNFHRAADRLNPKNGKWYSNSESVVPFDLVDCHRFTIEGFEINGNVDKMTRDDEVVEGPSYGILTRSGCTEYTLRNLNIHHFAADGICLGAASPVANKNVTLTGVRSTNNARNALSLIQVRGGTFIDCDFSQSGRTGPKYKAHAPAAGCDVEPEHDVIDVLTGALTFINCNFENNVGSQFASAGGPRVQSIVLDSVTITAGEDSLQYAVILAVQRGTIRDSIIDTKAGTVRPTWIQGHSATGTRTTIRDCEIRSSGAGLLSSESQQPVTITGCTFTGTQTAPFKSYLPYIRNPNAIFTDNSVFLPKEAYAPKGGGQYASLVEVRSAANNVYRTDLVPTEGGNEHFSVSYTSASVSSSHVVVDEKFASGAAFRPGNAVVESDSLYSLTNVGLRMYKTADRPAGYPGMAIVDATLHKVIYFDSSSNQWRDTAGNPV